MGANRRMASPEAYPAAFVAAVRNGGGVIFAEDMPWTTGSAAKRFRLFLAVIRAHPEHALHKAASVRWHVEATPRAMTVRMIQPAYTAVSVAAPLISMALTIGVNPNGTPPEELP